MDKIFNAVREEAANQAAKWTKKGFDSLDRTAKFALIGVAFITLALWFMEKEEKNKQ